MTTSEYAKGYERGRRDQRIEDLLKRLDAQNERVDRLLAETDAQRARLAPILRRAGLIR